jgi:hypothetical protein
MRGKLVIELAPVIRYAHMALPLPLALNCHRLAGQVRA